MKRLLVQIFLMILLLTVGIIIYVYDLFSSDSGWPNSLSSSSYADMGLSRIDPGTILEFLGNGDLDVFLPDRRPLDDRYNGPILYTEPILWSQSDNLKIVSAQNNFVWKDTLDNWSLFRMIFNVDCQDNLSGLPGGIFTYFKVAFDKGKIRDTWREFEIDPKYSFVAWGGGAEYEHPLSGRKSIDLSRLNVTAEDALRIAEENGGREARLKAQNKCSIHLSLAPEGYVGWWVTYNTPEQFEICINPYTGEVIK